MEVGLRSSFYTWTLQSDVGKVLSSLFVASRHARYTVQMVRMFEPLVNFVLHPCSVTRHQVFVYVRSTHTAVLVGFGCMSGLYQDVAGH